jgi:hypothetical protein
MPLVLLLKGWRGEEVLGGLGRRLREEGVLGSLHKEQSRGRKATHISSEAHVNE